MSTETNTGTDWDALSYAISSHYRVDALSVLDTQPTTPSNIEAESGVSVAHISRALQQLREKGMVELLVSEDRRKGRIYGLTEKGEDVAVALQERGEL